VSACRRIGVSAYGSCWRAARPPAQVGTRSRAIRVSTSDGHLRCTASDGRCTPARPASQVWNASVDVLRRTRRNAHTIRGAASVLTIGRLPRIARERVPTIASAPPNQIGELLAGPWRCRQRPFSAFFGRIQFLRFVLLFAFLRRVADSMWLENSELLPMGRSETCSLRSVR